MHTYTPIHNYTWTVNNACGLHERDDTGRWYDCGVASNTRQLVRLSWPHVRYCIANNQCPTRCMVSRYDQIPTGVR